jgi:M6 family metalloprotease-like protein
MRNYFLAQSYGAYDITCLVQDWTVLSGTEATYAGGVSGAHDTVQASKLFQPVLEQLNTNGMDWSQFDSDGDGFLDNVLVIHSGFSAAGGDGVKCGANAASNRIRGQGHPGTDCFLSDVWDDPNSGIMLNGFAITSAYERVCNLDTVAGFGTMAHELVHTFGPMDSYDITTGNIGGLGAFDIMANPGGYTGSSTAPGSLSPFSKYTAGWLTYEAIGADGTYTILPSNTNANVYVISQGFATGEYLVIENRQAIDFDQDIFGGVGGLLIYHCDESVTGFGAKGFPFQPGWPANGNHYKCALLPADGLYDLEQGTNNGDAGDIWQPGNTLGPGTGGVYPNTDSYQNGVIKETGIVITEITALGSSMSFAIYGLSGPAPATSPTTTLSPVGPAITDTPSMSPIATPSMSPFATPSMSPFATPTATGGAVVGETPTSTPGSGPAVVETPTASGGAVVGVSPPTGVDGSVTAETPTSSGSGDVTLLEDPPVASPVVPKPTAGAAIPPINSTTEGTDASAPVANGSSSSSSSSSAAAASVQANLDHKQMMSAFWCFLAVYPCIAFFF